MGINGKHLGIQIKDVFIDGTIWTDTGEKNLHTFIRSICIIHLKYTLFVILKKSIY